MTGSKVAQCPIIKISPAEVSFRSEVGWELTEAADDHPRLAETHLAGGQRHVRPRASTSPTAASNTASACARIRKAASTRTIDTWSDIPPALKAFVAQSFSQTLRNGS